MAVVDFRNVSKVPNDFYSSNATNAVAVELLRSGKFSVTASDVLQSKMEELGYRTKDDRTLKVALTPSMMVRLGQEVGAASVISGEVNSIRVDGKKQSAEVKITIRMLDVSSGEWMNGAVATGKSNPRIGYTNDRETDWIIEAINNAATDAVSMMIEYIIPEATVIGTIGDRDVVLNRGSQDGLQIGMEMIVLRRGETGIDEVVGRVKISQVTDTDARATITMTNRGVKPEDRVRAVFELSAGAGGSSRVAPRSETTKRIKKGSQWLWGLVAVLALGSVFKGGGSQPEGVPDTAAMAGASPDVISEFGEGGILVVWNNPQGIYISNIIQYHVWRDNRGMYGPIGGTGNVGPCAPPDQFSAVPSNGAAGSYEHSFIDSTAVRTFDFSFADPDTHELDSATITAYPGIQIGKTHQYYVSCIYKRQVLDDEGAIVDKYYETTPMDAGRATFLQRPVQVAPGSATGEDYADLNDITFEWLGCRGADTYCIEVSTSPSFERDQTWVAQLYQPTASADMPISRTFTDVLSVSTELAGLPDETPLYWRVGARYSLDRPGPYPAGPSAQLTGSKNTRYIYSDPLEVFIFKTLSEPPIP
jgi:hypothetical protein